MAITRNDVDPAKYDWCKFLDEADFLGKSLSLPRKPSGRQRDFTHLRNEIAMLLAEVHEDYEAGLDKWHMRNDTEVPWYIVEKGERQADTGEAANSVYMPPPRPKRKLSANWEPVAPTHPATTYDYSEFVSPTTDEEHAAEWEAYWDEHYGKGEGNPRVFRNKLPASPLDIPYFTIKSWWKRHVSPNFNPDFNRGMAVDADEDSEHLEDPAYFSPAGRMLYLIAKSLNPKYTPLNCNSLHDHLKRSRLPKK